MIVAGDVKYEVMALTGAGEGIRMTDAVVSAGFEENEAELAQRASITLRDVEYEGRRLSRILGLLTRIYIFADFGQGFCEVFRGSIWQAEPDSGDTISITAYDELFYMQKSQESRYFAAGTNTRTMIETIFRQWKVPIRVYGGPNLKHGKRAYKSKSIAEEVIDILQRAANNGGAMCLVRMARGQAEIVPVGGNQDVYIFDGSNSTRSGESVSMVDMVTKVVVLGRADKRGRQKVNASVSGATEYGVIQRTYNMGTDSLADAKKQAARLLRQNGAPRRRCIVESVDVPKLRKGDMVYVNAGLISGYAIVWCVAHDIGARAMRMEVELQNEG